MSLILHCDSCGRKMNSLEPSTIKNDKYLCNKCKDLVQEEVKQNDYSTIDPYEDIVVYSSTLSEDQIKTLQKIWDSLSSASLSNSGYHISWTGSKTQNCLTGKDEILTTSGWKEISMLKEVKIK